MLRSGPVGLALLAVVVWTAACGGGGEGGGGGGGNPVAPSSPIASVAGAWQGTIRSSVTGRAISFSLALNQSGSSVAGTFSCPFGCIHSSGNVTGTINQNTVTGRVLFPDGHSCDTFNGTLSGETLSGEYACTDPLGNDNGTWSVTPGSPPPVSACTYGLTSPKSVSVGGAGGSGMVTFTLRSGSCSGWAASSTAAWLRLEVVSGTGDIAIRYTVDRNNSGASREGQIQVRWPGPQVGENILVAQTTTVGSLTGRWQQRYTSVTCVLNPEACNKGPVAIFAMSMELKQTGTRLSGNYHMKYDDVAATKNESRGTVAGQVTGTDVTLTLIPKVMTGEGNYAGAFTGSTKADFKRMTGVLRPSFPNGNPGLPKDSVTIPALNFCPDCPEVPH